MKITRETLLKIIKEEAAAVGGGFTKDMTMAQAAAFADAEEAKERAKEEAAAEKERKAKYANQKYMKNDEVVAILEDIHISVNVVISPPSLISCPDKIIFCLIYFAKLNLSLTKKILTFEFLAIFFAKL